MSDYKWCHGPNCHTYHTVDRIRGSKDDKVLRTRKVKQYYHSRDSFYSNFCSNRCYDEFGNKYIQQIIAIAPRTEPLETPVNVKRVKHYGQQYSWGRSNDYYDTTITEK